MTTQTPQELLAEFIKNNATETVTVKEGSYLIALTETNSLVIPPSEVIDPPIPPVDPPVTDTVQGFAKADNVTGGKGGTSIVVTNTNASGTGSLSAAIAVNSPRIITFTPGLTGTIKWELVNYIQYDNITIDGAGADITISGMSLSVQTAQAKPVNNVIIKNLTFKGTYNDRNAIAIEYSSTRVWVDHCTFIDNSRGEYTGQGFAVWGRGQTIGFTGITCSWCKFSTPNIKGAIVGESPDSVNCQMRVSFHHNWFDGTASRNPRVHGTGVLVHAWNNYIANWVEVGCAISSGSDFLSEGNYFDNSVKTAYQSQAIDAFYGVPTPPSATYFNPNSCNHISDSLNAINGGLVPTEETFGTFPRNKITYDYVLEPATPSLKNKIMANAGANKG